MQEGQNEFKELIYKAAIFFPGVVLGLSAKLSKLNRNKKLTIREAIFQTAVAFSTAYVVWFILNILGLDEWKAPAMVLCGRFGDEIMIWLWKYARISIEVFLNSLKK